MGLRWTSWLLAAAVVTGATIVALALRSSLTPINLAMVYLLGLVGVAARSNRATAIVTALGSMAAFDFFCVPPYYTFAVTNTEYVITFGAMLVVALTVSAQTARIRSQAIETAARETRAQALYKLSDRLANETRVFDAARAAALLASEALSAQVIIFLREGDSISFRRRTSDHLPVPSSEETIADWVFRHGRKAGRGIDDLLDATALYVPLRGAHNVVGVMAVLPANSSHNDGGLLDPSERDLLVELFANHTALAIERTISQNAAEASRVQMQTEQMRSSLLSAVSHDLLTPLASITGAASTVRQQRDRISEETRNELLDSISEEAARLSRLVRNLLDITRFETGAVELRRDAYPLEEIIGTVLHRIDPLLAGREISVDLPATLPLVHGDEVLLGQVFVNILENAIKYTPSGSAIEITGSEVNGTLQVDVRDHGHGLPDGDQDRLFEKFYRSRSAGAHGAGLGLAISKAVVQVHGGTIEAFNHPSGGAVFRLHLPMRALPVEQPA